MSSTVAEITLMPLDCTIDHSWYEIRKSLMSFQKSPHTKSVSLTWQISHFGSKECEPTNLLHI